MARADRGVLFRLDLSGSRLRLDRLGRNAAAELSSPALTRIPREATKFFGRRPPLRCGPFPDAAPIASGLSIAIEAAVVAGS